MTGARRPATLIHDRAMEANALTILATIRRKQAAWTPGVLGLFVVVWLNLALQPCAMAMGNEHEHDCPRCPPSHQQHQHLPDPSHPMPTDGLAAGGALCPGVVSCAEAPGACGASEALYHDGRSVQPKVEDSPQDLPTVVLPVDVIPVDMRPRWPERWSVAIRPVPGFPPALFSLYCVYLD